MEEVVAAPGTVMHELVPQLRFPPGYRFVPEEHELVDVYLRAKIEGRKPPLDVVNDVSILDWQPGKLVEAYKGYGEDKWYFFTVREQSSSNKANEPSRKVRGVPGVTATWKATGSLQVIQRARSEVIVGSKRVLIYSSTDPDENGKWSMHEFTLQDHDEIGQYALYSIQRKQHSDTEDNKAGDDDNDMGSEKKTKKRKRTEKPCSTEPEGLVQLPHTETLAEPPLKPARKAKAQRKKKPSLQVVVGGEQQQQQQQQGRQSPMGPVTPPNKEELAPRQQEAGQQQPSVVVVGLSAVPLQVLHVFPPSEPGGMMLGGAPAPTIEEDVLDDDIWAPLNNPHPDDSAMPLFNNQGHQEEQQCLPAGLTGTTTEEFLVASDTTNVVDDHTSLQHLLQYCQQQEDDYSLFGGGVQNQQHLFLGENQSVYMEWQQQHPDLFLSSNNNTTQPIGGGWEYGRDDQRHQIHQLQPQEENNGVAFGFGVVQDQQPATAMNHHHPQQQQGISHGLLPPVDVDQQSSGSDDLSGGVHQMDIDTYFKSRLLVSQDLAAGTQEGWGGDGPATLQLQAGGTQEQWACNLQLQHALEEHVEDGPCSCRTCAGGLWDYYIGP